MPVSLGMSLAFCASCTPRRWHHSLPCQHPHLPAAPLQQQAAPLRPLAATEHQKRYPQTALHPNMKGSACRHVDGGHKSRTACATATAEETSTETNP